MKKFSMKSIITSTICGYLLGVTIAIVYHINFAKNNQNTNKWIASTALVLFVLILLYSRGVRCVLILVLPILCSSKGRSLLIALALFLAAAGPTLNIIANVNVLISSMSCGQTQLREALGKMLDIVKQPLLAVKEAITMILQEIRLVMERVQIILLRIKELVLVIVTGIKSAYDWLNNIASVCNKEFGTPFDRCMKVAADAMANCRDKLGIMQGLCNVTHLFRMLCYSVKFIDVICVLVVYFDDVIIQKVLENLSHFTAEVKRMFDVNITFDHDFQFKTTASKDLSEIGTDIMAEVRTKMKDLLLVFSWLNIISGVLCFAVLFKAIYFKIKYLHNQSYNNYYITKDFIAIDEKRKANKQEIILPLTHKEKRKYVMLKGYRLTRSEFYKTARSMLFLIISCIQLFCICFADYSLYWLLSIIAYYGHQQAGLEVPAYITVNVEGTNFIADIYRGIIHAFEPLSQNYTIDAKPCLPQPKIPNFKSYYKIAGLCLLAWVLLICQPYGLRLRHIVMRFFYPEETSERALWLYNQMLMKRMSFFKFARRKARAKFFKHNDVNYDDFDFFDWLKAKASSIWLFRTFLGHARVECCIICAKPLKENKVACDTLGCKAIYCQQCFSDSNNTCCVCKSPLEYGDFSDISEARDSSSDEPNDVHIDKYEQFCN